MIDVATITLSSAASRLALYSMEGKKPLTALSPKTLVQIAFPLAVLDYYETLRATDSPCFFIRSELQGAPLSAICNSAHTAWRSAQAFLFEAMRKAGA